MSKLTNSQFIKRFNTVKKRIAKDRDDLRRLVDEAEDLLDANVRACEALDEAADALSETF